MATQKRKDAAKRPFAAFDIDGTLIRWQLYHAIADELVKKGYIKPVAYGSIRDARMQWKRRTHPESFKAYEKQLVQLYEQILKKLSVVHFQEAANEVFEEYKDQVYTYTRDLIKELKRQNYWLFAISGSQTEVIQMLADYYGFDDYVGSTYLQKDGYFTGKLVTAFGRKEIVLKELVEGRNATYEGSIAVGDSVADIEMLEAVQNPITFNPERALFEHAKAKGWPIVVERKNMVYKLEKNNGFYQLAKADS